MISWSKYHGFIDEAKENSAHAALRRSNEIAQMMKVIGEEGTSLKDYIVYLKGEFFDSVYLQQNAFDEVDEATSEERQIYIFNFIHNILFSEFKLEDKENARHFFQKLGQLFRTWNSSPWEGVEFRRIEEKIAALLEETGIKEQ